MDLKLFTEAYKINMTNNEKSPKAEVLQDEIQTKTSNTTPKSKTITTSISDFLKNMETTGNVDTLPTHINEGVQNFTYNESNISTYRKGDLFRIQIDGNAPIKIVKKQLLDIIPVPDAPANSSGVNGEIDEKVSQGGTGDCWILSGVLALNSSEAGKQIIKESITPNSDGSVTVTFKGINVSYTISADEIRKHDTDNIKNDEYSNGDNDMLVLELAVAKLKQDIASGKVKLDVPADSWEGYDSNGSIEGGFAQQMIYFLTGKIATTEIADVPRLVGTNQKQTFVSEEVIFRMFNEALESGNTALNFGIYDGVHSATQTNGRTFAIDLGNGGHAFAITGLTSSTVTFVNPWDSTKEYTVSWEEFAKLGIGMLSATSLDEAQESKGIKRIENGADGHKYSLSKLKSYGFSDEQIEKYFDCKIQNFIYTLKFDIKIPGQRGLQGETIKTIQELLDITGISSKNSLKEQGLTDEVIDKYFGLALSYDTGKGVYIPKGFSKYVIQQNEEQVQLTITDLIKNSQIIVVIENGKIIKEINTQNDTYDALLKEILEIQETLDGTKNIEGQKTMIALIDRLLNCKDFPEERRLEIQSYRKVCEQNIVRSENYEKIGTDESVNDIWDELNQFVNKYTVDQEFSSKHDSIEYWLTYHETCISFYHRLLNCNDLTSEQKYHYEQKINYHINDKNRILNDNK